MYVCIFSICWSLHNLIIDCWKATITIVIIFLITIVNDSSSPSSSKACPGVPNQASLWSSGTRSAHPPTRYQPGSIYELTMNWWWWWSQSQWWWSLWWWSSTDAISSRFHLWADHALMIRITMMTMIMVTLMRITMMTMIMVTVMMITMIMIMTLRISGGLWTHEPQLYQVRYQWNICFARSSLFNHRMKSVSSVFLQVLGFLCTVRDYLYVTSLSFI